MAVCIIILHFLGSIHYQFTEQLETEYYRVVGDYIYYGHLDSCGDFNLDLKKRPVYRHRNKKEPIAGTPLISHKLEKQKVYELRSGALVPGMIRDGRFCPEEGGRVASFVDYHPFRDNRPIYNLPGRFVVKLPK